MIALPRRVEPEGEQPPRLHADVVAFPGRESGLAETPEEPPPRLAI